MEGISFAKGGEDPFLMPDDRYPAWLWTVHVPKPSLRALEAKAAGAPFVNLNDEERRRLVRLSRTAKMKANNAAAATKK